MGIKSFQGKREEVKNKVLSRTHGKAAEVQEYRDIFKRWISGLRRGYDAVRLAKSSLKYGKLSGPLAIIQQIR